MFFSTHSEHKPSRTFVHHHRTKNYLGRCINDPDHLCTYKNLQKLFEVEIFSTIVSLQQFFGVSSLLLLANSRFNRLLSRESDKNFFPCTQGDKLCFIFSVAKELLVAKNFLMTNISNIDHIIPVAIQITLHFAYLFF